MNIPKYSEYIDSMIAFVDILGFDKQARGINSEKQFQKIAELLFSLKKTGKDYTENDNVFRNMQITTISDSLIVTMPYKDSICAMGLITVLHNFQYELLWAFKQLLRGFLTRGQVYHNDGLIFGEGYSKAYANEGYIGFAPRIVIDPAIVEDGQKTVSEYRGSVPMDDIFKYIVEDRSDGLYFINYLKPVGDQLEDKASQLISEREQIKLFIDKSTEKYRNDIKISRKYKWLSNYLTTTTSKYLTT